MHHVAIMKKSWGLIPKIIEGKKTIESRWYMTKRSPWNQIKKGDKVFFKNSGEKVIAEAGVSKVIQFELKDIKEAEAVVRKYGKHICIVNKEPRTWESIPNYCILVFLEKPRELKEPFNIKKDGFGIGAAWLSMKDIKEVKRID